MNEKELSLWLKENVKIRIKKQGGSVGSYGNSTSSTVTVELCLLNPDVPVCDETHWVPFSEDEMYIYECNE